MNYFLSPPDIDVLLSEIQTRKHAEVRVEETGRKEKLPLFYDGETISGKINITLKNGKKLDHNGIKVEFIGTIQFYNERSNNIEFVSLSKELSRPGELLHSTSFPFEFREAEKPYESYFGVNVKLKYFIRVTIAKKHILGNITKEYDIVVQTMSYYPSEDQQTLRMDVGIEDALHIEFEYDKQKYHLKDVIVGKVYFLLVRLKIKTMEIQILRKESTGHLGTEGTEDCVLKYEIMDGSPARGESIPLRLFLAGYELQPTMRDIARRFSVRYFLNLVLTDEEDRRYYKRQEIILWRRYDKFSRQFQTAKDEQLPPGHVNRGTASFKPHHNSNSTLPKVPNNSCAIPSGETLTQTPDSPPDSSPLFAAPKDTTDLSPDSSSVAQKDADSESEDSPDSILPEPEDFPISTKPNDSETPVIRQDDNPEESAVPHIAASERIPNGVSTDSPDVRGDGDAS